METTIATWREMAYEGASVPAAHACARDENATFCDTLLRYAPLRPVPLCHLGFVGEKEPLRLDRYAPLRPVTTDYLGFVSEEEPLRLDEVADHVRLECRLHRRADLGVALHQRVHLRPVPDEADRLLPPAEKGGEGVSKRADVTVK